MHGQCQQPMKCRRFFVLEVASERTRDYDYFNAIWEQMEAGGYEAMLYDLLDMDISKFNVRNVPETEGLREQKALSMGTSEAWWFNVLQRGYVFKSKMGLESYFANWHDTVATELLCASYDEYAKSRNERHPMNRKKLGNSWLRWEASSSGLPLRQQGSIWVMMLTAPEGRCRAFCPDGRTAIT